MSTFKMELTFNGLVTVRLNGAEGQNSYSSMTAVTVDTSDPGWASLQGFHSHEPLLSFLAKDFVGGSLNGPRRFAVGALGEEIVTLPLNGAKVQLDAASTTAGYRADWSGNNGSMNHIVDLDRFGFAAPDTSQSISAEISGLPGGTLRSGPLIVDEYAPHAPLTFQFHSVPAPSSMPPGLHRQEVSNSLVLDSELGWTRNQGAPGIRIVVGNAYDFELRPEAVGGTLRLSISNLPSMIHLPVQTNDTTHLRWLAKFEANDPTTFRRDILLPNPVVAGGGASIQGKICPTTRQHV